MFNLIDFHDTVQQLKNLQWLKPDLLQPPEHFQDQNWEELDLKLNY